MTCECERLSSRIRSVPLAGTNIRVMTMAFECEDCGAIYRAVGIPDGVSETAPGSLSDGTIISVPIVRVGEEPRYRLAS
jgi:hypothetical protein